MRVMGRLEEPTVHWWLNALLLIVGLWIRVGLRRCDTDDRMVRRYAVCLTDTSTTLHRLTTSGASGHRNAERRGEGGAVAWSTGEGGVHHGGDQGRLRPLL